MIGSPRLLAGLLLVGLACSGCLPSDGDDSNVLEGACGDGETHCVDRETLQECSDGRWGEPAACPPEVSSNAGIPVEIVTWCSAGTCRPGG